MSNGIHELKDKVIVGGVVLRKRRFRVDAVPPPTTESVPSRKLRVFLCHASEDKPMVRQIKATLCARNVEPWLDEDELISGLPWKEQIEQAMSSVDVVLICFSRKSIDKEGYVQREMRIALTLADERPLDTPFLIPAKLEECTIPTRFGDLQWVKLFEEGGFDKLMKSLEKRAQKLGLTN